LLVAYFAVDLSSAAITSSPKAIMRLGCTSSSTHWTTSVLLYVGRRDIALCRSRGGGPVVTGARNATAFDSAAVWLLVASVTFVFFRWGPRSRYLYLPAMAFSLLASDGVLALQSVQV